MNRLRTTLLAAILLAAWPAASRGQGGVILTPLFSFGANYTNTDGTVPAAALVVAKDGSLYGTTSSGGAYDLGTVFKITTNGAYTVLASFAGANGATPNAGLVQGTDGNFYGTTYDGGANDYGTVFKLSPAGALTTLLSFNGTNGANPAAGLVQGTNGLLYGTTYYGGANGLDSGTVFRITTNGVLTRMYSFTNDDYPAAGLIQGKDGNFYGTTSSGGTDSSGSVFKITSAGVLTTLYSFTGGNDGLSPDAGVIQGKDGNFYGTTAYGGIYDATSGGDGTVFKITPAGVLTTLMSFNNTNGAYLEAALVQGADSILYGTTYGNTSSGSPNPYGTAFKITTNGVFTLLLSFTGANGAQPGAALVQATDGNLYGTTTDNGASGDNNADNLMDGYGTIFKLGTNGSLTTLYVFGDNNPNGRKPAAGLVRSADGIFYGTTAYGGTNHGSFGTVFRLATNGTYSVLASFNGTNGAYPEARLTAGPDGNFYGTTAFGGTNDTSNGGNGTVFRITTNGVLTALASLNSTNGANPRAELALGPDGNFYGTTENGGTNHVATGGDGAIFRITTNGVLTRLVALNLTNCASPVAGLTLGPDGNFYGVTAHGGTNYLIHYRDGTVFRVTTNGVLTRLLSFNGGNGANPLASLVLCTNGSLYGTASAGGAAGDGTIFKITTNGVLTTLYSFTGGNDGASPAAALVPGADGNFYGTTFSGGPRGYGGAFQITPDGTFTALYSFTRNSDGAWPAGALAEGAAGHFYGTAEFGGTNDAGTLFQLFVDPFPSIVTQPADVTAFTNATVSFTVSALGAAPLRYRWQRSSTNLTDHGNISGSATNTLTLSNVTLADSASYAVVVTNAAGAVTSQVATLTVLNPYAPAVLTEDATAVGINSATLNASVSPHGAATTAWFEWGFTTNYGSVSAVTNVGSGAGSVGVSLNATGLLPFSVYHFAAVAGNGLGTNIGLDMSFPTPGARSNVTFTPLVSFADTNGNSPQAGLCLGPDGSFYGTTHDGGANGDGTVFKLTTNGVLTTLFSFNGTNGSHPAAGLALGRNGTFYGTTYDGGTNDVATGGDGTVFKITTNGVFSSLASFDGTRGANPTAGLAQGADGSYYGTTQNGGTNDLDIGGDGTVFRITTNGVLTRLVSFNSTNGANPAAGLLPASNGVFYGTTAAGGPDDSGTIFSITTNGVLTTLYSFTGLEDGGTPEAGLVQGPAGTLFGTTHDGGDYGDGTVFTVTTNGFLTTLHSFAGGIDGFGLAAGLVLGADGNFYGTTSEGGVDGYGTVFIMTPGGLLAPLVLFDVDTYGSGPVAGLALGSDGNLYGTAASGGVNSVGTLFRFRVAAFPAIVVDPLSQSNFAGTSVSFEVAATGAAPLNYRWRRGTVNLTDNANIHGAATSSLTLSNLTLADGAGYSVVVSNTTGMATSAVATLTVIAPFPPDTTTQPATAISLGRASLNADVIPDGAATAVWFQWGLTTNYGSTTAATDIGSGGDAVSVSADVTGLQPAAEYHFRAVAANGPGTTAGSDLSFITPGARSGIAFTPLVSFDGIVGSKPLGGLMEAADGSFYGTTDSGGDYTNGTVFMMTAAGLRTTLLSFDTTNGSHPTARLVQGADGLLYGTTFDGGTNDVDNSGDGTVFRISTNGLFASLISFNGANGKHPLASLVQGVDRRFYSTTADGGANNDGTVFAITTNGVLTTLASFNGTNGSGPSAELALASDGNFYGTAGGGGTNDVQSGGDGTVFRITPGGTLTTLVSFDRTNGANPVAGLVPGAGGYLYGTTESGGTADEGTIFRITTNGTLTVLYSFTGGIDGASPQATLALGADGNYYGTTYGGGVDGNGTVFQVTPAGELTTLVFFDFDTYGGNPVASLLEGGDGSLYGATASGGTNSYGTLFRLSLPPSPPTFQSLTQTGNTLNLTWAAAKGHTYQLQSKTSLATTNWLTLTTLTATAGSASASDAMNSSPRRFYRVVMPP